MKTRRAVLLVLLIVNSLVIFTFSNQPGKTSSHLSDTVVMRIVDTYTELGNKEYSSLEKDKIISNLKPIVRKSAHVLEYLSFGLIFYLFISTYNTRHPFLKALIFVILFAGLDELHQTFISGRDGNVVDILIDTIGSIIGISFAGLITRLKRRKTFTKEKLS